MVRYSISSFREDNFYVEIKKRLVREIEIEKMKEITINNRSFQYKTYSDASEEGVHYWTEFYEGTKTVIKRKYLFFGPEIAEELPYKVFTIYADSSNLRLSKKWWKDKILAEIDILDRKDELERGELI